MSDILAMSGYAAFVWTSYGLAVVVLSGLALVSWLGRARALAALDADEAGSP